MPVFKRKYRSGTTVWRYLFSAPGSTARDGPGLDLRQPGRNATAAEFGFVGGFPAVPHSLRHSHGSHLLADGVPLPVVSERLGHSSVRTTAEVYAHAIRGQDDEAALRWDEFQRGGTQDRLERKLQ
jgi:integrase